MKKTNIIYWIFTSLISIGMILSSVPGLMGVEKAIQYTTGLGYPAYIVPFLGVAKILGVIAILVPGFPRLKEWAYAGLAFDLIGAVYSQIAKGLPVNNWIFMIVWFVLLFGSYIFYHKKLKATV